jgi:hypothetical protein
MLPLKQVGAPVTTVSGSAGVAATNNGADVLLVINAAATVGYLNLQSVSAVPAANTGMPIPPVGSLLVANNGNAQFWASTGVLTIVPVEVMTEA